MVSDICNTKLDNGGSSVNLNLDAAMELQIDAHRLNSINISII